MERIWQPVRFLSKGVVSSVNDSSSSGGGSSTDVTMAETYEVMIVVDPAVGMGLNIDTKNSCVIGE